MPNTIKRLTHQPAHDDDDDDDEDGSDGDDGAYDHDDVKHNQSAKQPSYPPSPGVFSEIHFLAEVRT